MRLRSDKSTKSKKNLLKPQQLAQLEKQDDQTLDIDGLVWNEKDVKEALKTFEQEGKKPSEHWLNDERIEVLCKVLASSETNGWAKMHNCAIIASLIKDTISLLCTGQKQENDDEGQKQENKVRNEMSIFVVKLGDRMKMVDNTSVCNFYAKDIHNRFVRGLDKLDQEKLARNFCGFDKALNYKNFSTYLSMKLTMLSWLFGEGVMAPKDMEAGTFSNELLKEWRSLIPPMMTSCGNAEKKKIMGVTNFRGKTNDIWPKLNNCLAEHRKTKKKEQTNESCVLVLGVFDKDEEDGKDEKDERNESHDTIPLAVKRNGERVPENCNKYRDNPRFATKECKFQGHLNCRNARRLHCLLEAYNQNGEGTDVVTVTPIKSEIQLRDDRDTPTTSIDLKNEKSAKFCHMVGNIDLRFPVELHRMIKKPVREIFVDHGCSESDWDWGKHHFNNSFFTDIIPWFATANFLEEEGTMWLPFEPHFIEQIWLNVEKYENLFETPCCVHAETCEKWNKAMKIHKDVFGPYDSLYEKERSKERFMKCFTKELVDRKDFEKFKWIQLKMLNKKNNTGGESLKKCPSNEIEIAALNVEQDKKNDHHEKTILSDESKVGGQNACDLSNICQNQSPKHEDQNQLTKHENHNKKLRVKVNATIVERWKKKWMEGTQTNKQLTSEVNNVMKPNSWITNSEVHRFTEVLKEQCKHTFFVSPYASAYAAEDSGMIRALEWILMKMKPEDLEKKCVIPVLKSPHWFLVVVDRNNHHITLYDSMANRHNPSDDELREWGCALDGCCRACLATKDAWHATDKESKKQLKLQRLQQAKTAFKHCRTNEKNSWQLVRTGKLFPQQVDGNNCGMFTMIAMFCICKGQNPTDCIWSEGMEEHRTAVACSVTESNLDAFQFEELQATITGTITGTITDEKGKKKGEAKCSADVDAMIQGTEKLQAMIPGTITGTITDEKGKKTWEAKCSADVDAMIQTKHNGQVKVEFTMDLTKMIKFKCGDEEKCMCNVFSVNTGRSKTVQFLWNDVTERYEKRKSKETTDTPKDEDAFLWNKYEKRKSKETTNTPEDDKVDKVETTGNHKSEDAAAKQGDEDSLSNGVSTGERNNTNTTPLNNVTEQHEKRKVKKRKWHGKGKSKKRKRNNKFVFDSPAAKTPNLPTVRRNNNTRDDCPVTDWDGLVTPPHSQEQKTSHSQEQKGPLFGNTSTTPGSHSVFSSFFETFETNSSHSQEQNGTLFGTNTSTTPGSDGLFGPHPITQDEGS